MSPIDKAYMQRSLRNYTALRPELSTAGILWGVFSILLFASCFRFLRLNIAGLLVHPAFIVLPIIFFVCQWTIWRNIRNLGLPGIGMFVFLCVMLISCLLNGSNLGVIKFFVKWFTSFIIIILVATTLESRKDIFIVLKCALIAITLIYSYGILYYIIYDTYELNPFIGISTRTGISNYSAAFFVAFLFFSLEFPLPWKERLLFCLGFLIVSYGQLLTYNRSGLICLLLSIILAFLYKPRLKFAIIVVLLITSILWSLPAQKVQSLTNRYNLTGSEKTGGDKLRSMYISKALNMFYSSPLYGFGPGSFKSPQITAKFSSHLDFYHRDAPSHNLYLTILAETGLIGFLSFSFFIFASLYQVLKKFRCASTDIDKQMSFIFLAGSLTLLVRGLFIDEIFFIPSNHIFWGLLLSYSLSPASTERV